MHISNLCFKSRNISYNLIRIQSVSFNCSSFIQLPIIKILENSCVESSLLKVITKKIFKIFNSRQYCHLKSPTLLMCLPFRPWCPSPLAGWEHQDTTTTLEHKWLTHGNSLTWHTLKQSDKHWFHFKFYDINCHTLSIFCSWKALPSLL